MAYINFCRDKKGEKCFKLKILGQIVKQGDSSR